MSAAGADNVNGNGYDNNIIFAIKDSKFYVLVVTLSARDSQKLSKLLSKGFERSVYWNEYKTKSDNKNTINEYRYFNKPIFVGVNRLFVLITTSTTWSFHNSKWQSGWQITIFCHKIYIFSFHLLEAIWAWLLASESRNIQILWQKVVICRLLCHDLEMWKLLVILAVIKVYAWINIFNYLY